MAINRDKVLEAAQKYVEKKKYDKAVAELRKLVEADPNDARTLLKIGDLQAKQGIYADAINTYESVGKLYSHQGFALKAIAVYKQIREIIAKHVPQLEERYGHIAPKLAELYQQLGLTSDALAALDEVATRLQRQQKDQEAIEVFRKIVELDPTNPLPHLRLAEALSRVKDVEGAVYEFKTAASQLAGIGRRDDALKVLERLLHHKADPEQAKLCAELYLARSQPQDGMQALAKLQICFQANPRDFDTLSLLARAFNAIGQGAKAIEVQKEMARVARDTGKTDLFREILERLMRVAPHDEGVRRLAQQTGSVQAAPPPYGAAAMADAPPPAPAHEEPNHGYPQQPPPVWGQQPAPPAPPYGARPNTQPLQRPRTDAFQQPPPIPQPAHVEEVDDDSYASYDDEVEELVEDADVVEETEDADAYAEVSYTEDGEAYATTEGDEYAEGGGEAYAEPQQGYADAYAAGGYAEPQQGYGEGDDYGVADAGDGLGEASPASEDAAELVAKTLADANSFRRVRLYAKALETLRAGLEIDPRSMDLHEVHRDVLIESGQTEEAVEAMLGIASLYVDALDGESAARALQDVLAFDPTNARAIDMLQELGYEIVDENEEGAEAQELEADGAYGEAGEHDARLPSYDLEEMGPADVSPQYADERQIHIGRGASPGTAGYGEGDALGGDALPSFPLDEPDAYAEAAYAEAGEHVPTVTPARHGDAAEDDLAPPPAFGRAPSGAPARPSIGAASSRELEDALDEAEFFCSRGLFDDARAIITEQLGKHPNHPLLRERLVEVDAQEAQRGSGAREKPRQEDDAFDLGSSLDALESLDYANMQPAEGHANGDEQIDVEEVFAKFKEGVAKQISVEDSDSHYNLGIAYKEMLLLDDAIREFDVAARDPKHECVCRSMIGMIQIERGNVNEAIEAFLQGLNASIKDPSQETVLCFEIGAAYEAKKMTKDALSYYQKAMRRDPNYRDVQERVRRLSKAEPKQNLRQAAVGADDEFDRAFDDLLSKA
ncbi:MAG: tetratricopeptide repeat protein [Labilithrix sp.]|nr:tetratricopeptide repeat protein [Labilithrix sp.]